MDLSKCTQPWFEMQIEYNETIGCCCYYRGKKDSWSIRDSLDIDHYWNSRIMQTIRKIIISNNPNNTGCEGCQFVKFFNQGSLLFTMIPEGLTVLQKNNWDRAIRNYNSKNVVVDSYPVKYYMNFGLGCNLRCIMCAQRNYRRTDKRQLSIEPLLNLKKYLIQANEIAIIGGEPFLLPNARKFINAVINDADYSNVKLSLFTNGSLLHHYLENLKLMKRVAICVSLDSTGKTYEYIRKGASWQQTEKNILKFKEIGTNNNLDWQVNIANIIMKSSISTLVDLVDWCIDNDFPCHFVPIISQEFTASEDVFRFPQLLKNIPDWDKKFDVAFEKLTNKGWKNAAGTLDLMKRELQEKSSIIENSKMKLASVQLKFLWESSSLHKMLTKYLRIASPFLNRYIKTVIGIKRLFKRSAYRY